MDNLRISPSSLSGQLSIPPSKSHTFRAFFFAMLGKGTSLIQNALDSSDSDAMKTAIAQFGAKVSETEKGIEVVGNFQPAENVIDAKNSGLVFRFISAISALLPSYTVITGDSSIRTRRPITPLLEALCQLGAMAESARGDGKAPILIKGPMRAGRCHLDGKDSQPVSALLCSTSFLEGSSEILVNNPGENPWIDMTLHWLGRFGAKIEHDHYTHYRVEGGLSYPGFTYTVPGDFSTAAFPVAAALVTHSPIQVNGLDPDDCQGDKILIKILQNMGAKTEWNDKQLCIYPSNLEGCAIDLNQCIDALPILAVLGCFAKGKTILYNGAIARNKETDRIAAICCELKKMGARIEEKRDGLVISQSQLSGAMLCAHSDHRIAMSLAVAALGAKSSSELEGAAWVAKTYPCFFQDLANLGASFELDPLRV